MPNNKSQEKRQRQNEKIRVRNRSARSRVRSVNKKFLEAVKGVEKETARNRFKEFVKLIDTAAGKGIYNSNTVARKKSRMHKLLNSLEG
ncbi:MAG: 30S ribosomal protein S20 [Spirochaetales bacterium]|nr:30S ribosomal protein S20 [Spirochaetales bacterium]